MYVYTLWSKSRRTSIDAEQRKIKNPFGGLVTSDCQSRIPGQIFRSNDPVTTKRRKRGDGDLTLQAYCTSVQLVLLVLQRASRGPFDSSMAFACSAGRDRGIGGLTAEEISSA